MSKENIMSNAHHLYDILKNEILCGKFAPGSKLPSIRALAQVHGLCTNTVNTAIAMLVSDGLATVRKGSGSYVSQAQKKSRMIGVMMFDFTHASRVDSGILEAVQENLPKDYYLTLVNTINNYDAFRQSIEHLIDANPAGLLIVPPVTLPGDPAALTDIHRLLQDIPTVFINRGIAGMDADVFSMDLASGMTQALEHLYAAGKRRTVVILHNSDKFMQEQLSACKKHASTHDHAIDTIPMEGTIDDLRGQLQSRIGQHDSLITSDNILEQMWSVYAENNILIPNEISLIGINNTLLSRMHNPPFTSIAFPDKQIGKNAIACLIQRIDGKKSGKGQLYNYKPEFIIRKT